MNIIIHATGFTADQKLTELIESKLSKLTTFFEKIISIDVYLKLESHSKIKDKTIEIKTHIPGQTLFAEDTGMSFEGATDRAFEIVKNQLTKKKESARTTSLKFFLIP
jgi:putative sigma-54 modulation protein